MLICNLLPIRLTRIVNQHVVGWSLTAIPIERVTTTSRVYTSTEQQQKAFEIKQTAMHSALKNHFVATSANERHVSTINESNASI